MLEQGSAFWSKAVTLVYIVLERFYINRKIKKLLKKNINVEISSTKKDILSIKQIVNKQIVQRLQFFKAK